MATDQISYSDAIEEMARALNDLAPVVEEAMECKSMNQALRDIGKIIDAFDPLAESWLKLVHIKKLIKDGGHVIKPEAV